MANSPEQLVRSPLLLREVNERIAEIASSSVGDPPEFLCECSRNHCEETIALSLPEYERVRSSSNLFVILPAPYFRRFADNVAVKAFVDGVTAAATGAIAGAAVVLGRRAIVDLPTAAIALGTLAVLTWVRRVPEPVVILAAGALGLALAR